MGPSPLPTAKVGVLLLLRTRYGGVAHLSPSQRGLLDVLQGLRTQQLTGDSGGDVYDGPSGGEYNEKGTGVVDGVEATDIGESGAIASKTGKR